MNNRKFDKLKSPRINTKHCLNIRDTVLPHYWMSYVQSQISMLISWLQLSYNPRFIQRHCKWRR